MVEKIIKNKLIPNGFLFTIKRIPNVVYSLQGITMPTVSTNEIREQRPFGTLLTPSTQIQYGSLEIRFQIDENMENYLELLHWIEMISPPESSDGYARTSSDIRSDGALVIQTATKSLSKRVLFYDCFPTSLSPLEFSLDQGSVEYMQATCSFSSRRFLIET